MKNSYRLYRRKGIYYVHDAATGKQKSLGTRDKKEAERIAIALNEAQDNRLLNYKIAEAHLAAQDPTMTQRTVAVTRMLAELGFHWNKARQSWQHPCGLYREQASRIDPRQKYGCYLASTLKTA